VGGIGVGGGLWGIRRGAVGVGVVGFCAVFGQSDGSENRAQTEGQ